MSDATIPSATDDEIRALHRFVLEQPDSRMSRALAHMSEGLRYGYTVTVTLGAGAGETATCRHCDRDIETDPEGRWVDPEATGDDSVWRETCDSHDTFTAEHEPEEVSS